ncbi:MAG: hypothetical protein MUF21_04260 [Gemmatimonadaceae bacterium]|nr:hypothetical protein [Gemmatimonadaceae bacterium]
MSAAPAPEAARRPLGRVVATERRPNTPHEFHFWTALDSPVGIGTIVVVDADLPVNGVLPRIYGVVVDAAGWTDLQTALDDVLGRDGDPGGGVVATQRAEIRLYTASVLRHVPDEPLQPVPMGIVHLASDADVAMALRMDGYVAGARTTGIPLGLYRGGGVESPVHLDADFLLGPEAAHLNITGVSGLATKTSAVTWLLQSIFAHFPSHKGSVAAVCFNVKGPDLLFLDKAAELRPEDRAMYERLGVPAEPFANVRYYAPFNAAGSALATHRTNEALLENVHPLTWGLREVLQYAGVLLDREDVDAKADALIDFVREQVVDKSFRDELLGVQTWQVQSFGDLDRWFRALLDAMERADHQTWRTHHVATIRKVRNRLVNLATRCAGLVTDSADASDLPFETFEDRGVYVIDVANLEEDAQDLVFARVVTRLREQLERRKLGVDHVVVFVDELNKYAPNDGPETYVRRMLLDIAERGRYLGLVLFSAQQFRSQVHRRVVGNAGTAVYGRMDGDELATAGYSVLSPAIRTRLSTLDKGQLMVRHPHFTQPVFVRFPRPCVMSGRQGAETYPSAPLEDVELALLRRLRRLDSGIELTWFRGVVALADEAEVVRAVRAAERERPADVKQFVTQQFRKHVAPRALAVPAAKVAPILAPAGDDPYGF